VTFCVSPVSFAWSAGDASFSGVTGRVDVTELDNDTAGVIVNQPNGPMVISADGTVTATYTVRLTSAPTSDVTITPVSDGLTTESPSALTFRRCPIPAAFTRELDQIALVLG